VTLYVQCFLSLRSPVIEVEPASLTSYLGHVLKDSKPQHSAAVFLIYRSTNQLIQVKKEAPPKAVQYTNHSKNNEKLTDVSCLKPSSVS